jgi:hypothetical protein
MRKVRRALVQVPHPQLQVIPPVKHEPGTEILSFSPSDELRTNEAVMMKNMQAMQDGSTP